MEIEINISKSFSQLLHKLAKQENKSFDRFLVDKYHFEGRIPIFEKHKGKIFKRIPLTEKVEISESEFKLYEALNERVITIRHASEKRKTHERI